MSWYREGLITLTNGSKTVTGTGTAWLDNVIASSGLKTPTGTEEIESVTSNTALQLVMPYTGPTVSGVAYAVIPTQGLVPVLAKQVGTLLSNVGAMKDDYLAGLLGTDLKAAVLAAFDGGKYIGFRMSGTGAVDRDALAKLRELPSVFDFIPVAQHDAIRNGTSTFDCTSFIVQAFAAHDTVKVPKGLYNVSSFSLARGKRLVTDGFATVFQQIPGQAAGTRMIKITGSDVEIGDLTGYGNITTDSDEQNHLIYAQANSAAGNLNNIRIGSVKAYNVRGDAVYIGQANGGAYRITNVRVGDVVLDNIYRNGVSIVSGTGIRVRSVTGDRVGFCHVDVESNATSGACADIEVGYVKGRIFGIIGTTPADYVDSVRIGILDLSPSNAQQCSPSYPFGINVNDGLLLRNTRRVSINHMRATDFLRCAIFTTFNSGELGAQLVEIGTLYLRNCSVTDTVYNAYIVAANSRLKIGSLDVDIATAGKYAFNSVSNSEIAAVRAAAVATSGLLRSCTDIKVGLWNMTGAGIPMTNCQRIGVMGGTIAGARLASGSNKCSFENVTATATEFLFSSNGDDHSITNCTLNDDFIAFGSGARSHLNCMRLGIYRMWVSADGKLRIKSSAPTSDTDGTVVGAQT